VPERLRRSLFEDNGIAGMVCDEAPDQIATQCARLITELAEPIAAIRPAAD
jgi:hypothetical protein